MKKDFFSLTTSCLLRLRRINWWEKEKHLALPAVLTAFGSKNYKPLKRLMSRFCTSHHWLKPVVNVISYEMLHCHIFEKTE